MSKKTVKWSLLEKRIPGLSKALEDLLRESPGLTNGQIAEKLSQQFKRELDELGAAISEKQIKGTLSKFSYKQAIFDFMREISGMEPKDIAKIFQANLPETSYGNPVRIETKPDNDNPKVAFINAPMFGLEQTAGVLRNALNLCQMRDCDAVVIPGNLIWLDLKKYSSEKPKRAEFSVREADDRIVFRSFKEKFDILAGKLRDQFFDEKDRPYFKGQIFVSLGKTELEVVKQYANEIVRRIVMERQGELRERMKELKHSLKEAKKDKASPEETRDLNESIKAVVRELSSTYMTNANDAFVRKIAMEMRKYIIYLYEKMLKVKVISCGQSFLSANGLDFEVVEDYQDSETNSALNRIINEFRGKAQHRDLSRVICVAGRTNMGHSSTPIAYRSRKKDIADSYLEQLPCCIDNRFIRRKRSELAKVGDVFLDAISSLDVSPGMVIYQGVKEKETGEFILRRETYLLPCLLNEELFSGKGKLSRTAYVELDSDSHVGSPSIALYSVPKEPFSRYHFQMAHDFLLHVKAPIVGYIHLGDIVQGHHYPFESRNPKELIIPSKILKGIQKMTKEDLVNQVFMRGIFPCGAQLAEYEEAAFSEYEDYFLEIIRRAKNTGIDFSGDMSPIIFLGGNHFIHTTEGELNDGVFAADALRDRLKGRLGKMGADADQLIKSPYFGDQPMGNGLLVFKNGGEYAMKVRHKEIAGATKYGNPLGRIVTANKKRGITEAYQQERFTINLSAHTHTGGFAHAPEESFDVGGSQTFHDAYGEMLGYPLNWIATKIIGVPTKGIAWGPIVRIPLEYSFFEKTSKKWKAWKIDKKVLFDLA